MSITFSYSINTWVLIGTKEITALYFAHYCTHYLLCVCIGSAGVMGTNTHLQEQCSKLPVLSQTQRTSQTQLHSLALSPRRWGRGSRMHLQEHPLLQGMSVGSWWPPCPPLHCWRWCTVPTQTVRDPPATRQNTLSQSATEGETYIHTYIHTWIHTGSLAPIGWGPTCMYYQWSKHINHTHTHAAWYSHNIITDIERWTWVILASISLTVTYTLPLIDLSSFLRRSAYDDS